VPSLRVGVVLADQLSGVQDLARVAALHHPHGVIEDGGAVPEGEPLAGQQVRVLVAGGELLEVDDGLESGRGDAVMTCRT
jgi:hypothetical protein